MISMLLSFKVGLFSSLIIAIPAVILNKIRFTTLDLTTYMGGLLTGQSSGRTNFLAGFIFHIIASVCIVAVYIYFINALCLQLNFGNALHAGCIHALISGMLMHSLDHINPCVVQGTIKPLGYFGSNYGATAVVTFVFQHVCYAVIVFLMLVR